MSADIKNKLNKIMETDEQPDVVDQDAMMAKAEELQAKIAAIEQEKIALTAALRRSLAIQRLWPQAFANGHVSTTWKTGGHTGLSFVIWRNDGEKREFTVEELPDSLKPTAMDLQEIRQKLRLPASAFAKYDPSVKQRPKIVLRGDPR